MKKTLPIIFGLLILLCLTSCTTYVNMQVNRPAEIDLSYAETISILPFAEDPTMWNYVFVGTDTYELGTYFSKNLQNQLISSDYFSIINSDQVVAALQNGKVPNCDVYIKGKIYNLYTSIEQEEIKAPNTEKDSENLVKYKRILKYSLNYMIIDSATGKILKDYDKTFSKESSFELEIEKVPSALELAQSTLKTEITNLIKLIIPYTTTKSIALEKDTTKNPQMEYAKKLVKQSNYLLAYNEYLDVYEKTSMFAAGYNAGCMLFVLERYEEAEAMFEDVYNKTGNPKAQDALREVQTEIRFQEKLDQQANNRDS